MQRITAFIVMLTSLVACNLEQLEPAQDKAFIKYFGEDGNTEAADLLKLDDGYLLLGNNTNRQDATTALLIKVDLQGNQLWARGFGGIRGSALAALADGYLIIGDSIKTTDPLSTSMSLIKTNLQGENPLYTSLGSNNNYHGTGITVSSRNEVVVCGYIANLSGPADSTFLYGYDATLTPSWAAVRKWGSNGNRRNASRRLYEDSPDNFTWTSQITDAGNFAVQLLAAPRDQISILDGRQLLNDETITDLAGGTNISFNSLMVVQTVIRNGRRAIGMVNSSTPGSPGFVAEEGYDVYANAIVQAADGEYVVLGATNKHLDGSTTRTDLDFYVAKVGFDGTVGNAGFINIIGGTGNETGVAIVQAEDRGFVFLGTMQNTNEVKLMMLVKVNIKGKLVN